MCHAVTIKLSYATKQSSRLNSIRNANNSNKEIQTEKMEDYLEIIYELVQLKSYAICVDISECLNVSAPSVTKMMQRLRTTGYLKYEKYRGIQLTEQGTNIAKNVRKRHELLIEFLRMIGVNEDMANADAEGIEHHLHSETLEKLEEFLITNRKK
jgi:Mn-dependent DtxR family transcriptional regulator